MLVRFSVRSTAAGPNPMPDVVLLYERSCPNVPEARINLLRAFAAARLPASWREVDLDAPETPEQWRAMGSPTILVDGADVVGGTPAGGATCRLYEADGRFARAPSAERIAACLRGATGAVLAGCGGHACARGDECTTTPAS
jgi:hypothetical protein